MRRKPVSVPVCLACFLWALAAISAAQTTAPQDRILQAIDGRQMTALRGNVHPLARPEFDQGRMNALTPLQGVTLNFKLSASQQADLEELMVELQDPASPSYHKWLTPEQYAARFGMSQDDLDQVTTWLQAQGFTDIHISNSRTRMSFNGTVARVEAAFRTEMHDYAVNGETHYANASEPSLPAAFSGTVMGFRHLDNFRPKPRVRRPNAHFTSSVSGSHFLTPGDVATIYDITPLYAAGIDGTGITIAVIGQTFINVADANTFRINAGLSVNPPQLFLAPNTGASTTFASDLDEANLDVEWAGGIAKNATILFDYAGASGNVFDALQDAIDFNRTAVISISYGNCEANIGAPSVLQSFRTLIQQGVVQGQTLSAAAGDSGAADCEAATSTVATTGLAVDFPGVIPEVTSVGGSEFNGDNTLGADAPYWAAASGSDNISSALTYIPEMAWNDSPVTGAGTTLATTLSATGGGASTVFTKPAWQTAATPADGQRDVPDVTLPASPNHDGYLVCSQGSCVSGFRETAGGNLNVFGGTSVSAQVFGGILALINQATKSAIGLGNANQELYAQAGTSAFHDITLGNNKVPCTSGSPNCPTSGALQIGFTTGTGYDQVTGLGSVDVNVLTRAWPGFNLTPTSTTTTIASSNLNAPAGATVTFTATIASAASGGPDITGNVQFTVDGSNAGSPVPVTFVSGQGFAATFSTSTLAPGAHAVAAVYAGATPNYAASTAASITETIGAQIATSVAVVSSNPTAAAATSITFTATVTPASAGPAITGTVQFVIDGANSSSPVPVSNSQASITTSALATGSHTIAAIYSGDSGYTGSTSPNITQTITGGFSIAGTAATIATPGSMGMSTITITPGAGFSGTVNLTCTPPASGEITCSFGSATSVSITTAASKTAMLTVSTTAAHAKSTTSADARPNRSGRLGWFTASGGAFFAGIFAIGVPSRRRRWLAIFGLLLCVMLGVGVGCGGGSSGGTTITDPGTAVGSYTVVVTGTSGSFSQSGNVTVTVQ